jgi:hypothetical protein
MDNFNWLKNVANINYNDWHNENVIRYLDIPNYKFYDTEKRYTAFIKPTDIKGIDYAFRYNYYDDITWLQLLNQLKNFEKVRNQNSSRDELIDHAHNDYNEQKTVCKYGDILITTTGQHRLALAKFLEIASIKVFVVEHVFNQERYSKFIKKQFYVERFKSLGLIEDTYSVDYDNCINDWITIRIYGNFCTIYEQAFDVFFEYYNKIKIKGLIGKLLMKKEELLNSYCESNLEIEDKSFLFIVRHLIRKHKLQNKG